MAVVTAVAMLSPVKLANSRPSRCASSFLMFNAIGYPSTMEEIPSTMVAQYVPIFGRMVAKPTTDRSILRDERRLRRLSASRQATDVSGHAVDRALTHSHGCTFGT